MKEFLSFYCQYNIWANQKLADFFQNKPEEQLSSFIENSFPSIRKTVLHILSAERSWLSRMQQDNTYNKSVKDEFQSTSQAFDSLVKCSNKFKLFVNDQNEYFLESPLKYNTWDGTSWEMQPKTMIHHCMNHSTYHRGQLITMARQLEWKDDIPSTDILFYWRENAEGNSSNRL
tara:strand:- start:447 stop:968 length:522 start_codon:yes stop_codon:yes gene_type:complete